MKISKEIEMRLTEGLGKEKMRFRKEKDVKGYENHQNISGTMLEERG